MMLVAILALLLGIIFLYRTHKSGERSLNATVYWMDMGNLFHQLRDDPFISRAKWVEWLPLFEDADRLFAETHPYITKFTHYAELVRREINDSPFQEVGS